MNQRGVLHTLPVRLRECIAWKTAVTKPTAVRLIMLYFMITRAKAIIFTRAKAELNFLCLVCFSIFFRCHDALSIHFSATQKFSLQTQTLELLFVKTHHEPSTWFKCWDCNSSCCSHRLEHFEASQLLVFWCLSVVTWRLSLLHRVALKHSVALDVFVAGLWDSVCCLQYRLDQWWRQEI